MLGNTRHIPLKTALEIYRIRKTSRIIENLFRELKPNIKPGITTKEINTFCENFFHLHGVTSAQKGYRGFPASVCVSPNHIATHGVPNTSPLQEGDIFTLDVTLQAEGWHSDAAWTFSVGKPSPSALYLIQCAWKTTLAGVRAAKAGNRLGDVGAAIQRAASRQGCAILEDFAGHGIGQNFHEEPIVANTGTKGVGQPLVPGMVFTIEPIVCMGEGTVKTLEDGWTVVTKDGSLTAQFEHTVAIFSDHTEVLTWSEGSLEKYPNLPPFY
ncbi:MAG: type I methionyl aminopeptidase [Spirochaetales bacterium]